MADFRFTVSAEESGQEVRVLMRKHFDFSSRLRNRIKRNHLLMINGEPCEGFHRVQEGDEVSVELPDETSHFEPENIPLDILYEDEDLMVIDKAPGIVVHPTKGHLDGTIANGLMYRMSMTGEHFKIRFVNRLDMDTSGLIVVAKNAYSQTGYIKSSDSGQVRKEYYALVHGVLEQTEGTIDLPIAPPLPDSKNRRVDPSGAPSITHYQVVETFDPPGDEKATDVPGGYSLLRIRLETGRTHQIRVHLSHIGHPIAGDLLYGGNREVICRQALHAALLAFEHPVKKETLTIEAPLPDDISEAIIRLRSPEASSF